MTRPIAQRRLRSASRGFTLIELLIVVTIIALLGAILAFALIGVQQQARIRKTQATIAKIEEILLSRWSDYESRRLALRNQNNPNLSRFEADQARIRGLRELMRMELPERWQDIDTEPTELAVVPAATQSYRRRISQSRNHDEFTTYEGAECLHLILTTPMGGEESARALFKQSEMGDVDGDGLPEFLDGWGQPIMFLRWAPAFRSDMQTGRDPDPLNPNAEVGPNNFKLLPLVYSGGPDEAPKIQHGKSGNFNDPFADMNVGKSLDDEEVRDNIHSHRLGNR